VSTMRFSKLLLTLILSYQRIRWAEDLWVTDVIELLEYQNFKRSPDSNGMRTCYQKMVDLTVAAPYLQNALGQSTQIGSYV